MNQKQISMQNLIAMFGAQCKSANLWITEFTKHQDAGSVRNAALSIGKVHGIYNVMLFMIQGDENLPEDIIATMKDYGVIWDAIQAVQLRNV